MRLPFCRKSGASRQKFGFSLVEVLIVIVILGTVVFLAIPNIVQVRQDSEDNLARSRAAALDVAIAAYFQANGVQSASSIWSSATSDQARYELLAPYLALSPATLTDYMPAGYTASFDPTDPMRNKISISSDDGRSISY